MKRIIRDTAAMVIAIVAFTFTAFADAPANDNFANAINVGNGANVRVAGTNEGATKEAGEPEHGFNPGGTSVWYKWTAPSARLTQITLVRSNFNTLLGVYKGSAIDALVSVGASNDISTTNNRSVTTFIPEAGMTYYIAVDGARYGVPPAAAGAIFMTIAPAINRNSTDYDFDGRTDLAVFRPSDGNWYAYRSGNDDVSITKWGTTGDIPVAGALVPMGAKSDQIVYRPSTGVFYVRYEYVQGNPISIFQFGLSGDVPLTGNFIGSHLTDAAVFRPANGTWYFKSLSVPSGFAEFGGEPTPDPNYGQVQFGQAGDIPVPGDYSLDSKTDIAVYRPSTGVWYILAQNEAGTFSSPFVVQFGLPGDKPVPGDYDGDGFTDPAIFRPSTGTFWVLRSSDDQQHATQFGLATDIPVTGDFDGDGRFDYAVFRPETGDWYIRQSGDQQVRIQHFGITGDLPVTSNVRN
jgi:hypothetical protein